jgi:DNA-binding TFAR19-related protein (PDSD5 family)
MRKHKMENSYEELKKLTRVSNKITQEDIVKYIETLDNKVKKELLLLNVENYIGYC